MAHTGLADRQRLHPHQQHKGGQPNSSSSSTTPTAQSAAASGVRRAAAAAAKQHLDDPVVKQVVQQLGSGKKETQNTTLGTAVFGGLLFAAGAAAWTLPWMFVLFAVICLPWRAYSFCKQKWAFYLIDFCYFVNAATAIHLLWFPQHSGLEALVYALSDGPLAGALVAWQCPWVFGSAEHTTSVLMHLLPGLALFAHRYHTPTGLRGLQGLAGAAAAVLQGHRPDVGHVPAAEPVQPLLLWLVIAPLAFYIGWQLLYFLVVQVLLRGFIRRHGYETSYTCLARRAAKTNNFWNRLVRRGSIGRRICMYGLLQLAFTVISCTLFLPTYFSYWLAISFQVVKLAFPIYYGARYQCQKVPQHVFLKGMQQLEAEKRHKQQQEQEQQPHTPPQQAAATAVLCTGCRASVTLQRRTCAAEVAAAVQPQVAAAQPPMVM